MKTTRASRQHTSHNSFITSILLAIVLGRAGMGWGKGVQAVSPEQVVADALAHSPALRISSQEVDAARAERKGANAQALPSLTLEARAGRYEGLVEGALGPGITIPAIEDRYAAAVRLSQPLYAGGRIVNQKRSAAHRHAGARQRLQSTRADLILEALTAYWNWSKAFYSLEALRAAVARMEAHAADMRNLHEAGLATDNDTLATDVILDRTRLQLEEALRRVGLAEARIAFLTGAEVPAGAVPAKAEAAGGGTIPPIEDCAAAAVTRRPDRAAAELESRSAEAQARASRAGLRPQVALTAHYEQARPNLLNIPPADEWRDDAFAGIVATWDVFDGGLERARAAQARARAEQARLRLQQADEQIVLEVRAAGIDLSNARDRVAVSERAESSARRNVEAATDLWKNGLARHAEVLDAHALLTEAEAQVVASRADVALAQAAFDHAVGRLAAGGE